MDNSLRVRFLDVGQGDAIVAILPGSKRAVVVDVFNADRVLDFLESEDIREVVLFLTHSHTDHTFGAEGLLTALEDSTCPASLIAVFFSNDRFKSTLSYRELLQLIGNAARRLSRVESRLPSGDFTTQLNQVIGFKELFAPAVLTVVHPDHGDRLNLLDTNPNEIAGVIRLELPTDTGQSRSVLLPADVQLTGISLMLNRDPTLLSADVLKFPHHGAWPTSWPGLAKIQPPTPRKTMSDFLEAVMPSTIVFSVGRENGHEHIRPEVIAELDAHYRRHQLLENVCCTQTTPSCHNTESVPVDGPLAGLADCGDIEICLDSAATQAVHVSYAQSNR